MKSQLTNHLRYNLWANKIVLNYTLQLSEAQILQPQLGSFPSIQQTWLHIWDAEYIWHNRLKEMSIEGWPSSSFMEDKTALAAGVVGCSTALMAIVENGAESFCDYRINYTNKAGVAYASTVQIYYFMWSIIARFTEVKLSIC